MSATLDINKTLSDISDTERNDIFYFLQALDSDSSDDQEFVEFIHLLAEKNYVQAQSMLGIWYSDGVMVKENFKEAVKWNTRAARKKCKIATYNLGWLYYMGGEGVDQDKKKGIELFGKSGELGHTRGKTLARELGKKLIQS